MSRKRTLTRRQALQSLGMMTASGAYLGLSGCNDGLLNARSQKSSQGGGANAAVKLTAGKKDARFMITLTCVGGASINDSLMALSDAEVTAAGGDATRINCYPEAQLTRVDGSPFKAVAYDSVISTLGNFPVKTNQADFVRKHMQDMMVFATEVTSVNHDVAQKRAVTGNDAWKGRTVQEIVAATYGSEFPLAHVNMAVAGFGLPGIDDTLPEYAKQVTVADPVYWPLGLHSIKGLEDAPPEAIMEIARRYRNEKIEPESNFVATFRDSEALKRWSRDRNDKAKGFEQTDLINKLLFLDGSANGLKVSEEAQRLKEVFPNYQRDSLDAQAIMAYLLITQGVSCCVTLGPSFAAAGAGLSQIYNPPIAFDFSHTDHRGTQAMMWARVMAVADKLIDLLKAKEYDGGQSYWDRSMIYFATEFGRDKTRTANATAFSSGHHLNNASLIISPMAKGNSIFGGIDPQTALTHGFDPASGAPDPGRKMSERELFAGLLEVMNIDTAGSGLPNMRVVKRG